MVEVIMLRANTMMTNNQVPVVTEEHARAESSQLI